MRLRRRLRRLGLPRLSRRAWLLTILIFLGLIYLGTTVVADFVVHLRGYEPQHYEPKDFEREERTETGPEGSP